MPKVPGYRNKKTNTKDVIENWRHDTNAIKKYTFLRSFLSQDEKKQRSPFLSHTALLLYSAFFAIVLGTIRIAPKIMPGVLGYASDIYIEELLQYTNDRRRAAGLPSLKINADLSRAAEAKAKDMFAKNYWAHVSPDGVEPWDFIVSAGYDYSFAGENLAKNFNSSKEVVDAWYDSPSHRENLLGVHYQDIGFAVVNGILDGYETTLVVQTFGKPRVPTYLSSSEPESFSEISRPVEVPITTETPATASPSHSGFTAPSADSYASDTPVDVLPSEEPTNGLAITQLGNGEKDVNKASPFFIDIVGATNLIGISFITFLALLLMADIWYSHRRSIRKVTGHTFAHLLFLLFVFGSIWLVLSPGKIL